MNHQINAYFIGHWCYFRQEINQIITQLVGIHLFVTIQCFLELFEGEAFFRTRQSGNHVAHQALFLFLIHLFIAATGYFLIRFRIFLFCPGTFQDEKIEGQESCPFKTQSLRAIRHGISQVGTCPVEDRHEVICHTTDPAGSQIPQGLFIVINITLEIAGLRLDMFVYRDTFHDTPD